MTFNRESTQQFAKDALKFLLLLVAIHGIAYSVYTIGNQQVAKFRQEGYDEALTQLVAASETQREINISVGDKTVKFVVIQPVSQEPTQP